MVVVESESDLVVQYAAVPARVSGHIWRWAVLRLHPLLEVLVQAFRTTQNFAAGPYLLEHHSKSPVQSWIRHD